MFNDETQVQDDTLQEETSEEVEESEDTEEESDEDAAEETDWEAEAKKWKAIAERQKKKKTVPSKKETSGTPDVYAVERAVLEANGTDEELLDALEKVAKLNGTTLLKAQKDPIFISIKESFEKNKRVEEAQVGTSRGSTTRKKQADFSTRHLATDDHKKLYKEALKNLRV